MGCGPPLRWVSLRTDVTSRAPTRSILVLAAVGLCGLAIAAGWFVDWGTAAEPSEVPSPENDESGAVPLLTPHRDGRAESEGAVRAPAAAPRPVPSAPQGHGIVQIQVVDDATGMPVQGFVWTLVGELFGLPASGVATGSSIDVRVPIGGAVSVRISAARRAVGLPVDVTLQPGLALRSVVVRLAPELVNESLVLVLQGPAAFPITRARITCMHQPERDAAHGEGHGPNAWLAEWTRESVAWNGEHVFAHLAPGRYRFKIVALDEIGRAGFLLPVVHAVRLTGTETLRSVVPLTEPAGIIGLTVLTAAGDAALGPGLSVRVTGPAGPSDLGHWIAADGDPAEPAAGTLPAAERCELQDPLPAGRYLVVVRGEGFERRSEVDVLPGQRTLLTIR